MTRPVSTLTLTYFVHTILSYSAPEVANPCQTSQLGLRRPYQPFLVEAAPYKLGHHEQFLSLYTSLLQFAIFFSLGLSLLKSPLDFEPSIKKHGVTHPGHPLNGAGTP